MEKRFNTIDSQTLMTMPLRPLEFVIENLLSNGLHVLAGSLYGLLLRFQKKKKSGETK